MVKYFNRQGGHGANKLVRIEEDFDNLAQSTAEERAEVNNITGSTVNLKTQVAKYANQMAPQRLQHGNNAKYHQPYVGGN